MPYDIYKKNGYKACKKGGKKCFSKKGMSKKTAQAQQRALYANTNESIELTKSVGDLTFVSVRVSTDEAFVVYSSKKEPNIVVTLVYTLRDSFYPEYEYFTIRDHNDPKGEPLTPDDEGDPQSIESVTLLKTYNLTPDDIEMAGEDAPDRIQQHWNNEDRMQQDGHQPSDFETSGMEESFEFEALFHSIMNEKKL